MTQSIKPARHFLARCLPAWALALVLPIFLVLPARAERIKDLAIVHGVRPNQLFGYGLVVGLKSSGDSLQTRFTRQSLSAMLGRMGVRIDPDKIRVRNVAAVMVSGLLPPFTRAGSQIDVMVSSIGDARSLAGGTLIFTPLKGADGKIYAIAQGALSVGGFSFGSGSSTTAKNHPTVGRIPQGALVEREVPFSLDGKSNLQLDLLAPDFITADRIAEAINKALGEKSAHAQDPGTIILSVPADHKQELVSLVARVEALEVKPDNLARVVINERTGTVVMGGEVQISTVAISHGGLQLQVRPRTGAIQPGPFSGGKTVVSHEDEVIVHEERGPIRLLEKRATLGDVVQALNAIGATPRDLIEILQAIKAAGALPARLEII